MVISGLGDDTKQASERLRTRGKIKERNILFVMASANHELGPFSCLFPRWLDLGRGQSVRKGDWLE